MATRITVNYQLLHNCSLSSRIIGWVGLVIIELSNGWEAFYLNETGWKENIYAAKSMMKPLDLGC